MPLDKKIDNAKFMEWFDSWVSKKHLSQSKLATQSGVSPSFIYEISANRKKPGYKLLDGLSKALGLPYDEVYAAAGKRPPKLEVDEDVERAKHYLELMKPGTRKQALAYLEFLLSEEEKTKNDEKGQP